MREAHKTPCDDIYCEQFLCVQKRDSEGHVELKDWDKHTADLRASNASLKAENEALKADITGMGYDNDSMRHSIANLQRGRQAALDQVAELERELKDTQEQLASFVNGKLWHSDATCSARDKQLAAFKNWQPSDPGTKEAMEWVTKYGHLEYPVGEDRAFLNEAAKRLAPALSAAMVRLEEAEKERDEWERLARASADFTASKCVMRPDKGADARKAWEKKS